jgi:hypothetical protein
MIASGALADLNSGALLGIVAQSRAIDLRDEFLAVADSPQPNGLGAEDFFDDAILARGALGNTLIFLAGGEARSFIIVADEVILGRASIVRTATGERAPVDLLGVVVHELTHARNREQIRALVATLDTDAAVYADTALAQGRSAVAPTANVLHNYVQEIVARHVHWIVRQEVAGTPGSIALLGLQADRLAFAALFYFVEFPAVFDSNGYGAGINAQGDTVRFRQLELWLGLCATQSFSDDAAQDQQATLLFQAAASVCADQQTNPTLDFPDDDGLVPLPADFH